MSAHPSVFNFSREAIFSALLARVFPCFPFKNDVAMARRLKLWGEVSAENRPALYQFEGGDEVYSWSNTVNPKVVLEAKFFVYWSVGADEIGSQIMNPILDAIYGALLPTVAEFMQGQSKLALGGLVWQCRIEGNLFRDPGDLDGDGMAVIPVKLILN